MPFGVEQFLEVFAQYNQAVYPAQIFLVVLSFAAIALAIRPAAQSSKIISGFLAFFWLWMGAVYHLSFFTQINNAAYIFGALFILQALIFFYAGVIRDQLTFTFGLNAHGIVGVILLISALFIYPLLGLAFGHHYPRSPTFGAPCPTTIFTFGLLLFVEKKVPLYIVVIPLLWSFVGFTAAWLLGVAEDFGLLFAGVIATVFILRAGKLRRNKYRTA